MPRVTNYSKIYNNDYQEIFLKCSKLKTENDLLKYEYSLNIEKCNKLEINNQEKDKIIEEKNKIIEEKEKEINRLKAMLNIDSNNSGLPTSKTPINKEKRIPNSRTKSTKRKGGQEGHKKHKLKNFDKEESNEIVEHSLEKCPKCGGNLEKIGEIYKNELTYEFLVIKRTNIFNEYKCCNCCCQVHQNIPNHLKEDIQYGPEIKSVALSLANEGNVSMNKIRRIIKGFSNGEIDMSEGFIAKLQKQASQKLEGFKKDLYNKIINEPIIYWDDTVIMIDKKRSCLRFYGNDKIAYYTSHLKKDEKGILEDNLLNILDKNTSVMHDHNPVNYKYSYQNLECNVHLIRDLQKCSDNAHHSWSEKLKILVQKILHDKNELIKENIQSFDDNYLNKFDDEFDDIMLLSLEESKEETHYKNKERALIRRILKYKNNYFIWMYDFSLPSDDNLSERALRGVKSKMKISGQFDNINSAVYFADIKTYIETCYRNSINPTDALIRLMQGNPYTVSEIFEQ